jgi:retron-type reverse transcriptase
MYGGGESKLKLESELRRVFGETSVSWESIIKPAAAVEWSDWQNGGKYSASLNRIFEKRTKDLLSLADKSSKDLNVLVRNAVALAAKKNLPLVRLVLIKLLHDKRLKGNASDWLGRLPKSTPAENFLASFIQGKFKPTQGAFAGLLGAAQETDSEVPCVTNLLLSTGGLPQSSSALFSILARHSVVKRLEVNRLFDLLGALFKGHRFTKDLDLVRLQRLPKSWRIHILADPRRSKRFLSQDLITQLSNDPTAFPESKLSLRDKALAAKLGKQLKKRQIDGSTIKEVISADGFLERLENYFDWSFLENVLVQQFDESSAVSAKLGFAKVGHLLPLRSAANIALLQIVWLSHQDSSKRPYKAPESLTKYLQSASPEVIVFCIRNTRGLVQSDVVETINNSKIGRLGAKEISEIVLPEMFDQNTDVSLLLSVCADGSDKKRKSLYSVGLLEPHIGLNLLEKFGDYGAYYASQLNRGKFPKYCVSDEAFAIYGGLEGFGGSLIEAILAKLHKITPSISAREIFQKTLVFAPASAPAVFAKRGVAVPQFVELISNLTFSALSKKAQVGIFELKTPKGKSAFREAIRRKAVPAALLKRLEGNRNIRHYLLRYTPSTLITKKATIAETLSSLVYMPSGAAEFAGKYKKSQVLKALPRAIDFLEGKTRLAAALELAVLSNLSVLPIYLQLIQKLAPPFKDKDLGRRFDDLYTTYKLPKKSGGSRTISAPAPHLKLAQRSLLELLYTEKISDAAMGFRPGKSIRDNAILHVGKEIVVNADIRAFFPSTTYKQVYSLSRRLVGGQLSPLAARFFAEICCYDGHLATGAPTSPAVSNLILKPLDDTLVKTSNKLSVSYSRYADDVTFSGDGAAVWMLKPLKTHLSRLGYQLDPKKTNIFRKGRRQTVTGAVVNAKVTLARPLRKMLRAAVHRRVNGGQPSMHGQPLSDQALKGYLAFLSMLSLEHAKPLLAQLEALGEWKN